MAAVCCMCGDEGLSAEIFRCSVCQTRSQHKYCSDLYPKAEFYGACNWCLREKPSSTTPASIPENAPPPLAISSPSTVDGSGSKKILRRSSFPSASHLSKPMKQQRRVMEALPALNRSKTSSLSNNHHHHHHHHHHPELSPTTIERARHAIRGKARRYKLLEEVSS